MSTGNIAIKFKVFIVNLPTLIGLDIYAEWTIKEK